MSVIYRELKTRDDFEQCLDIQRNVFHFSEAQLVSPLLLNLIARENPPLGIALGVFKTEETRNELLGVVLGFATFLERSVYIVLMGVKHEYKNSIYGYKLLIKFREIAIQKGLKEMYCIFEPLKSNLARLYCNSLGFTGINYLVDSSENPQPTDKLYVRWEFSSQSTVDKIKRINLIHPEEAINQYPVAEVNKLPNLDRVLVEIPDNFILLKDTDPEDALHWRMRTREIFYEYINNRKYYIIDCISVRSLNGKKTFYLLEKSIK